MTGNPWIGVLTIAAAFGGGLFVILLLFKAEGVRAALTEKFRLPLLIGLVILGLVVSVLVLRNGVGSNAIFCFLLAINLFNISEAPRSAWARVLLWLDGALVAAATAWSWKDIRAFAADNLVGQLLTLLIVGVVLYAAGLSLYRLLRPRADLPSPSAETGTPA